MATYRQLHPWNVSPQEAQAIQNRLRSEVKIEPLDVEAVRTVAGADISFDKGADTVYAGFVVLRLPTMEVGERAGVRTRAVFPYILPLVSGDAGAAGGVGEARRAPTLVESSVRWWG